MDSDLQKRIIRLICLPNRSRKINQELESLIMESPLRKSLFDCFSEEERSTGVFSHFVDSLSYKYVPKGGVIFAANERNEGKHYYVVSGEVTAFQKLTEATPVPTPSRESSRSRKSTFKGVGFGTRQSNTQSGKLIFREATAELRGKRRTVVRTTLSPEPCFKSETFMTEQRKVDERTSSTDVLAQLPQPEKSFFTKLKTFAFVSQQNAVQKAFWNVFLRYFVKDGRTITQGERLALVATYGPESACYKCNTCFGFNYYKSAPIRKSTVIATRNTQLIVVNEQPYKTAMENVEKVRAINFKQLFTRSLKCRILDTDFQFLDYVTNGVEVG